MSDVPLTEKRFLELFEIAIRDVKTDIKELKADVGQLKTDVGQLKKDMIEVKGFIRHESDAIEYELQQILLKYLKKKFQTQVIRKCPIKVIKDPFTGKDLTDLDAALIIEKYTYNPNFSRLKEAGLPIPSTKRTSIKNLTEDMNIFVLAEAKHYIDLDKIKTKLQQFDKILNILKLAKKIQSDPSIITELSLSNKFIPTIKAYPFLSQIEKTIFAFGAAYWEKNLLSNLENALKERKKLVEDFKNTSADNKVFLYKQICELEKEWYENENMPNKMDLSEEQILNLKEIDGAMGHIKIIKPSGNRYDIEDEMTPFGTSFYALNGGSKTRRR